METQETGLRVAAGQSAEMIAANERFNSELDAFKNKVQRSSLHLGRPIGKLMACGVNVEELTISRKVLSSHQKKAQSYNR